MTRILLVHGSGHGAWCWEAVLPFLHAAGHEAVALDMPGRGENPIALEDATLDDFAASILHVATPGTVLVGHSAGGYAITAAAQAADEGLSARLIFVCAFVPEPGRSLAEMRRLMTDPPLLGAIRRHENGRAYSVDADLAATLFFNGVPPPLATTASDKLVPEAILPQETPIPDTSRAEALPRRYVLCERDRVILPHVQAQMTQGWPNAHVARMPVGHSPFLADPEGLARRILSFLDD